ncbi:hypothetical protein EMCRGX_G017103 [Ephydatia muelleri]
MALVSILSSVSAHVFSSQVWTHVLKEPVVREAGVNNGDAILETGAKKKKRVYEQAVVERRGKVTPVVLSVDGLLHRGRTLPKENSSQPGSQMGKALFPDVWIC